MSERDEMVLLALAGKRPTATGWVRGNCPWCEMLTGAPDRSLALGMNTFTGEWKCLAGETRVLTWEGPQRIDQLAGRTVRILTKDGKTSRWVDAPFSSFGVQELMTVTLSRNGVKKTIRATPEHRWFVARNQALTLWRECVTQDLTPGMRLQHVFAPRSYTTVVSPWGVAHGFAYGDGHQLARGGDGVRVSLFGAKDAALSKFYPLSNKRSALEGAATEIDGLPRFFKSLPDLDEAPAYLYGWLAGYFAADGCVSTDGNVTLASASRENLEFVRRLCIRIGVQTRGIKCQMRTGYSSEPSALYSLTFGRSSLTEEFFLIEEHRRRWIARGKVKERCGWVVDAIERTGVFEEVFCAEVAGTHNFALEDDILTGNCFRCHSRGLIQQYDDVPLEDVVATQTPQRPKPTSTVMELPEGFVDLFDGVWSKSYACAQVRDYLKGRGVTAEVAKAVGIGAVFGGWLGGRVVVPIVEADGSLAGWSARLMEKAPPDIPKYLYPSGMNRGEILFNAAALTAVSASPLFVVEGVFDALSLWPDAAACLGKPSPKQIDRMAEGCRQTGRPLVSLLDGDAWREAKVLARMLGRRGVRAAAVHLAPKTDPGASNGDWLRSLGAKALEE